MKKELFKTDFIYVDKYLVTITFMLLVAGITMVYSASSMISIEKFNDPFFYFKRQFLWILIGVGAMFSVQQFDYQKLEKWAGPLLVVSIFLLILVLIPSIGREVSGGRRWLPIGIGHFAFQPSELVKITLLIFFASFLAKKKDQMKSLQFGFLPALAVLSLCTFLIFLEPDLGNAILIVSSVLTLFFFAGARLVHILGFCLASLPFMYYALSSGFRLARMKAFLNPWEYADGAGFQLIQSFYSFGRGGFFGEGLGNSQQKMLYLPEAHTDFIFSVIGEEFGLIGTCIIAGLFFLLAMRGFSIAKNASNDFGRYLAVGISIMISYQALFNMAVTLGLVPTKGLPLPFISAGGSSMVFTLIGIGLLLSISRDSRQ